MCIVAIVGFSWPNTIRGADSPVNEAISRGVEFLISVQSPNGSIDSGAYQVAMTGCAVMAMAAAGHQPTDPTREGEAMGAAIDFVLRASGRWNGHVLYGLGHGVTYQHGMTTLALCEVLRLGIYKVREPVLRQHCQSAINLLAATQLANGSWNYQPYRPGCVVTPGDLTLTTWPLLALQSAAKADLDVPQSTINGAVGFVVSCFNPVRGLGFSYVPGGGPGTWARNTSGSCSLQVSGMSDSQSVAATVGWLRQNPPAFKFPHFFYGAFHYAQVMQHFGGATAQEANSLLQGLLLPTQRPDGSWLVGSDSNLGRVYCTSIAVIALSARDARLPLFRIKED